MSETNSVTTDDGTRIQVYERAADEATAGVLFCHGATFGGRAAFDPEGYSWLDDVAAAGRTAVTFDVRGYGDSDTPSALKEAPTDNPPVSRAATAVDDAKAVLARIRADVDEIHLVGYSWGSIIAGILVAAQDVDVASLTQYAPVYSPDPELAEDFSPGDPPRAYRTTTRAETRDRWETQHPGTVPDEAFDAFWTALIDSNQHVGNDEIQAPNGTLVDLDDSITEPLYDPTAIDVPTLVVRGSADRTARRSDALTLYDDVSATDRFYVEIAGGTHFMQFEAARDSLYETVESFHRRVERRRETDGSPEM